MNRRKLGQIALALAAVIAAGATTSALARGYYHTRARVGVGVYVGPGWGWGPGWGPGWYPYGPYYYPGYYPAPAVVAVPPPDPPQYVEQGQDGNPTAADDSSPNAWWYRCNRPAGYYPYIKECPGGWQRVEPQVPSSSTPSHAAPGVTS